MFDVRFVNELEHEYMNTHPYKFLNNLFIMIMNDSSFIIFFEK